jgi:hypothetical protein
MGMAADVGAADFAAPRCSCGLMKYGHRKRWYPSRRAAEDAAASLRQSVGGRRTVYPCPTSDVYHLSHETPHDPTHVQVARGRARRA